MGDRGQSPVGVGAVFGLTVSKRSVRGVVGGQSGVFAWGWRSTVCGAVGDGTNLELSSAGPCELGLGGKIRMMPRGLEGEGLARS